MWFSHYFFKKYINTLESQRCCWAENRAITESECKLSKRPKLQRRKTFVIFSSGQWNLIKNFSQRSQYTRYQFLRNDEVKCTKSFFQVYKKTFSNFSCMFLNPNLYISTWAISVLQDWNWDRPNLTKTKSVPPLQRFFSYLNSCYLGQTEGLAKEIEIIHTV